MTRRMVMAACLVVAGFAGDALAQGSAPGSGKIPVEQDVRRAERIDRRLGVPEPGPASPNVSPGNPTGVAGFNGPPGTVGDSVNSYSPLPPGAPGNEIP